MTGLVQGSAARESSERSPLSVGADYGPEPRTPVPDSATSSTADSADPRARFLLVEIEPGLDRSRHTGIWLSIKHIPGVASITLHSAITDATLDTLLLTERPPARPERAVAQGGLFEGAA